MIREADFLAVVAEDEWDAVQAAAGLEVEWQAPQCATRSRDGRRCTITFARAAVVRRDEPVKKGDLDAAFGRAQRVVEAEYEWPLQSHASMGPACALADVKARRGDDLDRLAEAALHARRRRAAAGPAARESPRHLGDGTGLRTVATTPAMPRLTPRYLSKLTQRPVRVQGMRADGTAWDPKGPAVRAPRARRARRIRQT